MKNFFSNKIFIAVIFLFIGFASDKILEYFQNHFSWQYSSKSFSSWLRNAKDDVEDKQQKIFTFNGKKLAYEIKSNFNSALNKTSKSLENTQKKISNKFDKITKANDPEPKQADIADQIIKKTEVRKYEDDKSFSFDLILTGFRHEDVIIAINQETLNFSSSFNPQAKMIINNKQYSKGNDSQAFYHSFNLPKYDHKIDPEISYKNNIVSVKFFKISK
jgi:HSP20 family molecular chaperone IbpA